MLRSVISRSFALHLGETLTTGGSGCCRRAVLPHLHGGAFCNFAGWPALRDGVPAQAALNGAILGLVAYGTYEFTSWARDARLGRADGRGRPALGVAVTALVGLGRGSW